MKTLKTLLIIVSVLIAVTINGKILTNNLKLQTPEQKILGIWIMENSPSDKIEFLPNGVVNIYIDNTLESTYNYIISNECNGIIPSSSDNNGNKLVLKYIYPEGDSFCNYILSGVYEDNNHTLSLLTEGQGKIIVYMRP